MKGAFKNLIIVACVSLMVGCVPQTKPQMTPLEIQSLQTREYETSYDIVFRSVISVFQDLGYTIQQVDKDTGFVQANSAAKSDDMLTFLTGYTSTTQTKATAFVEEIAGKVRVRINFVVAEESSTAYGADQRDEEPILDADVYQNAFEKIENAIFVRSSST